MPAPGDHSLLELINAATKGNQAPVMFSDQAVAAMHRGEFPSLGRGEWTVTDLSGAGLTFQNNVTPGWYRVGQLLVFWADITFPTTADTNPVLLSGIPNFRGEGYFFVTGSVFSAVSYADNGTPFTMYWDGEQVTLYTADGVGLSNADFSGKQLSFAGLATLTEYVNDI